MEKNNGTNIASSFLDRLDKDAKDNSDLLTEEMRKKFVKILEAYMPQAQSYVASIPRNKLVSSFINLVLTMRLVEFKADEALKSLKRVVELTENRNYSKSTKDAILKELGDVEKWIKII